MAVENSYSVHSLLAILTNGCTSLGYDVLLDITGQFRSYGSHHGADPRHILSDTVIEMNMAGRRHEGNVLHTLCNSLLDSSDQGTLLVLLLCARNIRQKRSDWPPFLFIKDHFEKPFISPAKSSPTCLKAFCEPPGIGDKDEQRSVVSKTNASCILRERADCIADAARFNMEHQSLWISKRLEAASPRSVARVDSAEERSLRLISFIRDEHVCCQRFAMRSQQPTFSNPSEPIVDVPHRDSELLQFILARCVSGIDEDKTVLTPSNEVISRSPLALRMLQENNVFEEETRRAHTERSRYVQRRRIAVSEYISSHSTTSEHYDDVTDLIQRSETCGAVYRDLVSFADAYAGVAERRTLRAVADFAFALCRAYFCTVLAVAADTSIPETNKPRAVIHAAESLISDGSTIADALERVEGTNGTAVQVINTLLVDLFKRPGNETVSLLFYTAVGPYFDNIYDWVFEGSSRRDLCGEFFGTTLGILPTDPEGLITAEEAVESPESLESSFYPNLFTEKEALFLLRAGRTRHLLQYFDLQNGVLAERPSDIAFTDRNVTFYDVLQSLNQVADRVEKFQKIEQGNQLVQFCNTVEDDGLRFSPKNVNSRSLKEWQYQSCEHQYGRNDSLGQSPINDCIRCWAFRMPDIDINKTTSHATFEHSRIFSSSMEEKGNNESNALNDIISGSSRKVRFPYGTLFSSELLVPLRRIDNIVQREVFQYFVQKLQLFEHFRNLRAYVLLGAGDFANELVEQLEIAAQTSDVNERFIYRRTSAAMTFYGSDTAGERTLRDRTYLNQCLRTALNLCSAVANPLTDLLYLELKDGVKVQPSRERRLSMERSSLWESKMEIRYNVGFPLDVVITPNAMNRYSMVFGLFLRILRARKSLRSMFVASRRKRAIGQSNVGAVMKDARLAGRVWQFCWHAEHFVSIFGGFVIEQVLGSCWDEFERQWETVTSIWDLRDGHSLFLDNCIRRCLLGEKHKAVLKVMTGGFEIVVNVNNEIAKLSADDVVGWTADVRSVIDLVGSGTASLKRRCAFLTDVLERLSESGTLPQLEYLLTRLNFNYYYEKTELLSNQDEP